MEKYNLESSDEFLSNAIDYHIGDIRNIPEIAQGEIRRVYQYFFSAYHKIAIQMPMHKNIDILKDYGLNPKVIEYMRHFFSDYQVLYREFTLLNRNAGALLKIDWDSDPARFQEQLDLLLTGKMDSAEKEIITALVWQEDSEDV